MDGIEMEEEVSKQVEEINFDEEQVEIETENVDKEEEIDTSNTEEPSTTKEVGLDNEETPIDDVEDDALLDEDTPQDSENPVDSLDPSAKTNSARLVQLPLSRIKQIIKLDEDVDRVNAEAVFVITKATELFLECFAKEVYKVTSRSKKKTIQLKDVTTCIDDVCCMQFLEGIFPQTN